MSLTAIMALEKSANVIVEGQVSGAEGAMAKPMVAARQALEDIRGNCRVVLENG